MNMNLKISEKPGNSGVTDFTLGFSLFFLCRKPANQVFTGKCSEIFNRVSCTLSTGVKEYAGKYEHASP